MLHTYWRGTIWLAGARALELLLGPDSAYVRDILTEELAKGLDAYWRMTTDDALDAVRASLVAILRVHTFPRLRFSPVHDH